MYEPSIKKYFVGSLEGGPEMASIGVDYQFKTEQAAINKAKKLSDKWPNTEFIVCMAISSFVTEKKPEETK